MTTCEEVQKFMSAFVAACAEIGVAPEVCLTVMLFETGSSLSAWYTSGGEAFGLLQWTKNGAEPIPVQQAVGISNPTEATKVQAYEKLKGLNRLEQLVAWKAYYLYWYKTNAKKWENISDPYLKHYVLTLAPNGGPDYKDGNGVTAKSLTGGLGAAGKNFQSLKTKALAMLKGEVPVPGEDSKPQRVTGLNAYLTKVGTCKYTGGISAPGPATPAGGKSADPKAKTKTLNDLLPVELSFTIPEYPKLVGMKAGDVLILPATSQLRDWLVTSITRTFTAGMNTLTIKANRPLDPKPFVQAEALAKSPREYMAFYYGSQG